MNVYLKSYLAPFELWLARDDVTDILVNRPGEVWVETTGGGTTREAAPDVTEIVLQRLARQIAGTTHQGVNREQPLLSASLPAGARVQIVAPPATRQGLALAIRKHTISNLSIEDLDRAGLFRRPSDADNGASDATLAKLLAAGDQANFLREAVKARKTIVISGGTSSGKTTLLNALVKLIDAHERLIVIEDTPEIKLDHANALGLIAVRGELGEARVGAEDLLEASAAHAARSHSARRIARQGSVHVPPRGQHGPSGLDHDGACGLGRCRGRTDHDDGAARRASASTGRPSRPMCARWSTSLCRCVVRRRAASSARSSSTRRQIATNILCRTRSHVVEPQCYRCINDVPGIRDRICRGLTRLEGVHLYPRNTNMKSLIHVAVLSAVTSLCAIAARSAGAGGSRHFARFRRRRHRLPRRLLRQPSSLAPLGASG